MMAKKPCNPWPPLLRRLLHKILPRRVYRRYIGRHEDTSLAIWRRLARSVDPGTVILDIGAFYGEFSLAAREENYAAEIFAFEPNPLNLDGLRSACESGRIEVVAAAVAEKDGFVRFVCDSAQSHIADDDGRTASEPQDAREFCAPAVAIDTWATERSVIPSLVKIDVEGAESAVLRGAKRIFVRLQPSEVVFDSGSGGS
ncbi:MAG: FkbM family methyltransferase [Bryobacterales bacterium]|nr:FkbM family methyltransferase [Bryobacterales bacterium]